MKLFSSLALVVLFSPVALAIADWSPPVNVSDTEEVFSVDPCVAWDAGGYRHVVWEDFRDSDQRLFYAHDSQGSWAVSDITPLEHTHARIIEPVILITPDAVIHVIYCTRGVYRDPDAYSAIWEVTRPVAGGPWSAPLLLHRGHDTYNGWAAMDSTGGIYANYLVLPWDDHDPGQLYGRYKPLGEPWGDEEIIQHSIAGKFPSARTGNPAHGGYIIADEMRFLLIFACDKPYYRVRDASGTWSNAMPLNGSGGSPRIAVGPHGEVAVAWHQDIGGDNWFDVFVKTSGNGGTTWGPAANISNDSWLSRDPELVYDAGGNLYALWQKFDHDGAQPDLWYRVKRDGTWSAPFNITRTSGRTGAPFQALRVRDGQVHLLYSDNTQDGFEDVYWMSGALGAPPTFTITPTHTVTLTPTVTSTPRPRTPTVTPTPRVASVLSAQ